MRFFFLFITALASGFSLAPVLAAPKGPIKAPSKTQLLWTIASTHTGRETLRKATLKWKYERIEQIATRIEWAQVSRTDAVVVRKFDPISGAEIRERQVKIYLNQDQPELGMVLDLAHELTHAINDPDWDPYDPKLSRGRYIQAALEGSGGEIEAIENECRVAVALKGKFDAKAIFDRCGAYLSSDQISRDLIKKDIYRIGKWKRPLEKTLGVDLKLFPALSGDAPVLYSSTGNAPYPVALAREYQNLNRIACKNTIRRLQASGRKPAGDYSHVDEFVKQRCVDF